MTKKLRAGDLVDVTPESWKTGQEGVKGTISVDVEKKTVTVNMVTDRARLDAWRSKRKPLLKPGEKK